MPLVTQRAAKRFIRERSEAVVAPAFLIRSIMDLETDYDRMVRRAELNRQLENKGRIALHMRRLSARLETRHLDLELPGHGPRFDAPATKVVA